MTRHQLSGAVMTHPKRRHAAERMAQAAPPGALRVVMDPDPTGTPSVLRTALAAWDSIEDGATHQLVVQDDMLLSESFFERVDQAVAAMPDAALALFALWDSRNGAAIRFGAMAGARWVGAVNEYFPCVAIVLPRTVAEGFVRYGRERLGGWPDDILMHRYLTDLGVPRYVSVPNLAEHQDHGSISGNAFRGPRRSVCFLPDDRAGDEDRRLTGLRVLPFFKYGVARCAVRVDGPGPERWLHMDCEQYLRGLELPRTLLVPPTGPQADAPDVRGTWLTALAMGHEAARLGLDPDGSAPAVRPEVYAEAIATIGSGGISNTSTEERIAERREVLADAARRALAAGHEAAAHGAATGRTGTRRAHRPGGLTVRGGASPLGEHLVRRLTDLTGPAGADGDGLPEAVLDLTGLREGGPARELRIQLPDDPRPYTLAVGEVYGPGCSRDTLIGRMVWDALRSLPVTVQGSPEAEVHPVYVDDLADAVLTVIRTRPAARTLTVADEKPTTLGALANAVHAAVRPVPVLHGPSDVDLPAVAPEFADGSRPPGWAPATAPAKGLHAYSQWLAYEGTLLTVV
ncbi:NAD-dependent epimerase/dehydratase family protein [Kitasatospora sp. NPDC059463]|uniref:NAD-dependent epimerase/dehydratase family protein n=1 Tax=unclassified Kitasatospora TaxID=2633591 RepID=UPI00368C50DD